MSDRPSLSGILGRYRTGNHNKSGSGHSRHPSTGLFEIVTFVAQLVDFRLVALLTQPGLAIT